MANTVQLVRTKFTDIRSGDESLGYRIFDDYGASYGMFSEAKPSDDDGDFLHQVSDGADEEVTALIEWGTEHGMSIDGMFYTAEQVQKIFNPES